MYNGIGLQTPRGSGTNGYVQTNKFLIRGKTSKVVVDGNKGFGPDQGMGGISKKANKEILEHDRKRQIELKLVILEDKLSEQGYTDAEIAEKCEELRRKLEAEAAADDDAGAVANSDKKVSDTETHQIAARKEKQMEKLRAALGITAPDVEATKQGQISDLDIGNDDDKLKIIRKDDSDNDSSEREEGEILHGDEEVKIEKHHQAEDRLPNQGGKTKKEEKRRSRDIMSSDSERTEDSSASDSDGESKRKKRSTRMSKKNISVDSHDPDSDSDNSDKERQKNAGKYSRGPKRHDSSSDSDNSSRSPGHRTKKSNQSVISDRKMPSIGSNRSKRNELEKDDYGRRYVDKYYKGSDISAQGTNSAKLEPERSQRSRRRDINDVVDSDNEDKKEKSHRRGRHDSEDEDSDVETKSKERAKDKEKQLRYLKSKTDYKVRGSDRELISHGERNVHDDDNRWAPNTLEDEQIYKKYENLEAEDGTRKRERRSEGEHGSRKHESKEEGAGGRKLESKEDIDQERRKWEKKVEDGSERRKKGIDEDDNDRRKLEREEKDMHERRGQERREEDELRKRKLESSKNDEERNRKLEQRDADDYRSKKRVRRDENERGGRKGGSREEDEKQGRSRERRDEDELVYRKQGGSKREGEEDDDLGGKYRERREQEQRLRNDRKEHDRHGNKNRETLEEEGRRRRRHEREEDSPQKHETHRRDDVRRRH